MNKPRKKKVWKTYTVEVATVTDTLTIRARSDQEVWDKVAPEYQIIDFWEE